MRLLAEIRQRDIAKRKRIDAERAEILAKTEALQEEAAAKQRALDLFPTMAVVTMLREALGEKLPAFLGALSRVDFTKVREQLVRQVATEAEDRRHGRC